MSSAIELIKMFYTEGFFSEWQSISDVKNEFEKRGFNFSIQLINNSLNNAVRKNILSKKKISGSNKYSQRQPPEIKIKEKETTELNKVFSDITKKKLGERFQQDIRELNVSFTNDCGNSAAFILRKTLEKAIFFVLSTNGKASLMKDSQGKSLGLNSLINLCASEDIKGVSIILPKTAQELLGMKFLGDSAAHDYLANVELTDINHQLSYWTMAIKQLVSHLK